MNYEDLITDVAKRTGLHTEVVRKVFFHLPDSLARMGEGDTVRTPLGMFRVVQSKARVILLPDQESTAAVPARAVVKLKSGPRLKIEG